MILKFFPKGRCNLAYCLGVGRKHDPRNPAVLAGDAAQAQKIINGLTFANPFTSLALSYDRELSPVEAQRDIADFEAALFPGLDSSSWARVWIRHTENEKNPLTREIRPDGLTRTALHCIIANVHLPTGKRLQPYFDRADRKRMEAWQELTNHARGYASPKDPGRRRAFFLSSRLPKTIGELKATLNETVIGAIENGEITTRENLCEWLKAQGFEIARITKKSISLKHSALKKHLRLEGAIYEDNGLERTIGGIPRNPPRNAGIGDADLARYHRDHKKGLERKLEELFRKYESRARDNNAAHGGTVREVPAAGAMDSFRRERIDFIKPDGVLVSDFQSPATASAANQPTVDFITTTPSPGGGAVGSRGENTLHHIRGTNLLRHKTLKNHERPITNEHRNPQSHAHGDGPFGFVERIRSRAKQTLRRFGALRAYPNNSFLCLWRNA